MTKAFDHMQNREITIAENKREVYRRLLQPWEGVMVNVKGGKEGEDLIAAVDLGAMYASSFDAVLYGSEEVVQRYVAFRTPQPNRDPLDMMIAFAHLLVAMREDVTGKKTELSAEAVLSTIINFSDDERAIVRMREFVSKNPEKARRIMADVRAAQPGATDKSPA